VDAVQERIGLEQWCGRRRVAIVARRRDLPAQLLDQFVKLLVEACHPRAVRRVSRAQPRTWRKLRRVDFLVRCWRR
jgi:hypothetical protein